MSAQARRAISAVLICLMALPLAAIAVTAADPDTGGRSRPDSRALLAELGSSRVARRGVTGQLRFVAGTTADPAASSADLGRPASACAAARRFMDRYGALFGVTDVSANLSVERVSAVDGGRTFVRYQQVERGVPVLGALLNVQVEADGDVISAHGEASARVDIDVRPRISAEAARSSAISIVRGRVGAGAGGLTTSSPQLWIYDPALLGGRSIPVTRLVWRMDARNALGDVNDFVLIDAHLGAQVLRFDQVAHAKHRQVCDAANANAKVPCTAPFARAEGGPRAAMSTWTRPTRSPVRPTTSTSTGSAVTA